MDKATIQLPKLRKEFGLLSKAYREEMKKTGQVRSLGLHKF
jgi:hypothetical protein